MTAFSHDLAPAFRSSQRISITLPHHVARCLQQRCDDEGRSLSNLAAYLLESSIAQSRNG